MTWKLLYDYYGNLRKQTTKNSLGCLLTKFVLMKKFEKKKERNREVGYYI